MVLAGRFSLVETGVTGSIFSPRGILLTFFAGYFDIQPQYNDDI